MTLQTAPITPVTRILHTIFRQKWAIAFFAVVVMCAAVTVTYLTPPTYLSEAKLFLRLGKESAALDPASAMGQASNIVIPGTREYEIASVVEMVLGQKMLDSVIDKVGLAAILDLKEDVTGLPPAALATLKSKALSRLRKGIFVESIRKSLVVRIAYEGRNPEVCQKVIQNVVDTYEEQHGLLHGTPEVNKFLFEYEQQHKSRLAAAEEVLQEAKLKTQLISPENQRQLMVTRVSRLIDDLLATESNLIGSEAEVRSLRAKVDKFPEKVELSRTTGQPNVALDGLRSSVYNLKIKEQEVLPSTSSANTQRKSIEAQLKKAEELLDKALQRKDAEQVMVGPNRMREDLQTSLSRAEASADALRARKDAIQQQLDLEKKNLDTLIKDSLTVARLQRAVDLQEATLRKIDDAHAQARFDQERMNRHITNLGEVQPATFDPVPIRPNKTVNLSVGLGLALVGGIALAFLREYLDHSFRTGEDLEAQLGLPALASIPNMNSRFLSLSRKS
jgi:uncharacterized protein involved in exopolysaccharide biosynthesis